MSEETTETVEAQEQTQAAAQTTPQEDAFDAERAKALIDKLRNEIKELKPKAKKADELSEAEQKRKEAEMTELDRLNKQLADAQAEVKRTQLAVLQRDAAAKYSLPAELAARLKGETPEELEADAKALAALLPKAKQQPQLSPTQPGASAGHVETKEQMKARLGLDTNPDIFAPDYMKAHGGGAFTFDKEN